MHSDFALEIAGVWARAAVDDAGAGDPAAFAASVVRVANEVQRGLSTARMSAAPACGSAASAAAQSAFGIAVDFQANDRALLSATVDGVFSASYAAMAPECLPDAVAALVRELLSERDARNQRKSG